MLTEQQLDYIVGVLDKMLTDAKADQELTADNRDWFMGWADGKRFVAETALDLLRRELAAAA